MKQYGKDVIARAVIGLLVLTGAHAGSFVHSTSFSSSGGGLVSSVVSSGDGTSVSTITGPDGTVRGDCVFRDSAGRSLKLTYWIDRYGKKTVENAAGVHDPARQLARCLRVVANAKHSYSKSIQMSNEALNNIFSNIERQQTQFQNYQRQFANQANQFSSMMANIGKMMSQWGLGL